MKPNFSAKLATREPQEEARGKDTRAKKGMKLVSFWTPQENWRNVRREAFEKEVSQESIFNAALEEGLRVVLKKS